jgi:3-hydroxyisobutyrate dehydrogenase
MQVGYIGLGNMGGALAAKLQESRQLVVFDLDAGAVGKFVELGSAAAGSLEELAQACDVVFLCLPTSDHVRSVLYGRGGEDGLAASLRPGTVLVDQTSGDPVMTKQFAQDLAEKHVALVDAPVSGGIAGARAGTISIMVGADQAVYESVLPIFNEISPNILYAGETGSGHVMKLVNNMISGVQRLLTFEGIALAAKNGVDPERAIDILMGGGARNSYMEKIFAPRVLQGDLNPGFTLALAHKDMRLACDLARASGTPVFFGGVARELLQVFMAENGADAQVDTAALVVDRWAGTQVVPV